MRTTLRTPEAMGDAEIQPELKSEIQQLNVEILQRFVDKCVEVCRDDSTLEGVCRSIDGYLNVILENSVFKDKESGEKMHLKTCFVVGSSIKHIRCIN